MTEEPTYQEVLALIQRIRESFDDSVKVYTEGSCVRFAMILKQVFKKGEVVWNEDHAAYHLNGHYYDITGDIENKNFIPIIDYGILKVDSLLKLKYSPPIQKKDGN